MGERKTITGESESSSEENGQDSSAKKKWVRPPLVPSALDLHKNRTESAPAPRPPLFEQMVVTKEDDEEEDDDGKAKPEVAKTAKETDAEEVPAEADVESSETRATNTEATEETEVAVEEGEPEAAEADQDDTLEESRTIHLRNEPEGGAELASSDTDSEEDEDAAQTTMSSASGGSSTPPPPPPTSTPSAAAQQPPTNKASLFNTQANQLYNWNIAPQTPNVVPSTANTTPAITPNQLKNAEQDARREGMRRGLVAGFLTGYILKAYLAGRKRERYEKAAQKQMNERDEQITSLEREQQQLSERLAARVENREQRQEQTSSNQTARIEKSVPVPTAEALPPIKPGPEEQIFDQEGNEIILQPGWRVERSAGGYSVVLDEHNRVVHNAIRYGEAFKRDQKREQLSDDLFAAIGAGAPASGPTNAHGPTMPAFMTAQPSSGQPVLPGQPQPTVDVQHRLPEPRSRAAAAGPWVVTAVALLIIVYFIAALV